MICTSNASETHVLIIGCTACAQTKLRGCGLQSIAWTANPDRVYAYLVFSVMDVGCFCSISIGRVQEAGEHITLVKQASLCASSSIERSLREIVVCVSESSVDEVAIFHKQRLIVLFRGQVEAPPIDCKADPGRRNRNVYL